MALAQIGGETAIESLLSALDRKLFASDEDRAFLYLALGLCGARSEQARTVLRLHYGDARSAEKRGLLALCCGLARDAESVSTTIARLDRESNPEFAAWACLALGLHGDPRGAPVVRRMFDEHKGDATVREHAAIAMTMLQRNEAVPHLVRLLRDAGSQHSKAAVVTALGLLPEPSRAAVDALIEVYKDDSAPDGVRAMAIIALGALGDPRPVPLSALLTRCYNYFIRSVTLDEIASFL
jgi:HEAT repeat protein